MQVDWKNNVNYFPIDLLTSDKYFVILLANCKVLRCRFVFYIGQKFYNLQQNLFQQRKAVRIKNSSCSQTQWIFYCFWKICSFLSLTAPITYKVQNKKTKNYVKKYCHNFKFLQAFRYMSEYKQYLHCCVGSNMW